MSPERLRTATICLLACSSVFAANVVAKSVPKEGAPQTSTLCKFSAGPRAGQTQDYAPMAAIPVGSACQDGAGSTGTVVAPDGTQKPRGDNKPAMSTVCKFSGGPRAGQTHDYAPMAAIPVGSACQDGAGSTGTVIAAEGTPKADGGKKPTMSTVCKFSGGPRAGQTHDYAPMAAIPVGSACQDGAGSTGTVIAAEDTEKADGGKKPTMSTVCKFSAGPRAGQTHDYAPMAAIPIGSACQDGAGSTGSVVAPVDREQ